MHEERTVHIPVDELDPDNLGGSPPYVVSDSSRPDAALRESIFARAVWHMLQVLNHGARLPQNRRRSACGNASARRLIDRPDNFWMTLTRHFGPP